MNLTVITPPPFEPVTLAEVRAHLRLDAEGSPASHPDDAMLTRHIATARAHVEQMSRRSLVQQTLRLTMSGFPITDDTYAILSPVRRMGAVRRIRLYRPPIVRILSVGYYDGDNSLQSLSTADYYATDDLVPELRFLSAFSSPTFYDRPDTARVDYVAGYVPDGSPATTQAEYAANVPSPLKDAILLTVQLLYDALMPADREAIERTREALIQPYRVQIS